MGRLHAVVRLIASGLVALILAAQPILAQDEEDDDDVYDLSPFEVVTRDDRGYLSTNTTAGTSLNMLIRDLPMSLEVINREFIEDLGATDMREALSYSAGVFLDTFENTTLADGTFRSRERSPSTSVNVGDPFNNSVSIRGYSVPNQQRLGFRVGASVPAFGVVLGGTTDTSNTERQEVVRGPQSLLYGINVLSGVINIVPRRPLPEERTRLNLTLGSYDLYRATVDQTGPLVKDKLNYRVMYTFDQRGDWTDHLERERKYMVGQLDWTIMPKLRLFVEGQYLDQVIKGGGPQFFRDGGSSITQFENKWGERYTFGLDYFDEETIDDPAYDGFSDEFGELFGRKWLIRQSDREYAFPNLGEDYRISGPDVRRWDEEKNFLALLHYEPTDRLAFEFGSYYTESDTMERKLTLRVDQGSGPFIPNEFGDRGYKFNPELRPFWDLETDAPIDPENWVIGRGPGELWIRDDPGQVAPFTQTQRKYAWYAWYKQPTRSESLQNRIRGAYTFDTEGMNGLLDAQHTITGGINYIRDKVWFVNGGLATQAVYSTTSSQVNHEGNRLDQDPFILRPSVFDYSIIRLGDNPIFATPGNIRYTNLGDQGSLQEGNSSIARSGWFRADLWHKGIYGVYHGEFFNGRLNLIAGIREDSYQVEESEKLTIIDEDFLSDNWTGTSTRRTVPGGRIGFGNQPYTWRSDLPDELNRRVEQDINTLLSQTDGRGTVEKNFAENQTFVTNTLGLNYRLTESFSAYYLYSEGIFPNTGLRDGSNRPIDAEQTTSNEIGVKFDLLDGRISGTFSVFEIRRENAVWDWFFAPAPAKWAGGPDSVWAANQFTQTFGPQGIREGVMKRNYGVRAEYVEQAYELLGLGEPPKIRGTYTAFPFATLGVSNVTSQEITNRQDPAFDPAGGARRIIFWVNVDEMDTFSQDQFGEQNPMELALDLAVADKEGFNNLEYQVGQSFFGTGYSASIDLVRTANVTFEERGRGIDGQTIFSVTPNYQIIVNYSYQKREVVGSGFNLQPGYQLDQDGNIVDDTLFTTRWDRWVWILGPENFEDPANPATLKGGAIKGIDLSFVPKWSFRIWNKYQFTDGRLEGLEIAGGVRGNGPTPTTVAIGGSTLSSNLYPTPDVPSLYFADAMISYRFQKWGGRWRVALNVNNLLDKRITTREVEYTLPSGEPLPRRTRVRHDPRAFRFSVSADF